MRILFDTSIFTRFQRICLKQVRLYFTGDITLIATAAAGVGYKMYAAATDGGSPSLTSSTGATIRIDTYDPSTNILNYFMNISRSTFLGMETTFLNQLTTVYQQTYPKSEAKRWCVVAQTSA